MKTGRVLNEPSTGGTTSAQRGGNIFATEPTFLWTKVPDVLGNLSVVLPKTSSLFDNRDQAAPDDNPRVRSSHGLFSTGPRNGTCISEVTSQDRTDCKGYRGL